MSTIGERLKKAREDTNLTLKRFAELSKIQIKYIEQLEEGRYEKLPAFVYVRGFLKKYSEILNLPLEELLGDYKNEVGTKEQIQSAKKLPLAKSPRTIITPKKIRLATAAMIIVLVFGYLIYQLDFLTAPPKLSLDYPAQDLLVNRSSIEILGSTDWTAKLTVNGQQIFVASDGKFHREINLSPGVNTLKIVSENRFGKKSEIIRQIVVK